MKAIRYAVVAAIFAALPNTPQAQHQVDMPHTTSLPRASNPNAANIDSNVGTNFGARSVTAEDWSTEKDAALMPIQSASTHWLQQQSDALLDVMGCYLDAASLANEVAAEKRTAGDDVASLVEQRIECLKTLAQHNAASHCEVRGAR